MQVILINKTITFFSSKLLLFRLWNYTCNEYIHKFDVLTSNVIKILHSQSVEDFWNWVIGFYSKSFIQITFFLYFYRNKLITQKINIIIINCVFISLIPVGLKCETRNSCWDWKQRYSRSVSVGNIFHINYPNIKLDKKSIHWLSEVITTENNNDFIDLTNQKNRQICCSRKIETTN
jgi:hypothetical protein